MTNDKEIASKQLVDLVVNALDDKKGLDILSINFSKAPNTVARYFVICHGSSNVHVNTLAEGVIDKVNAEIKSKPWNKEGHENAEWILLDYADVVVHIFQENTRKFYNLEGLWGDMQVTKLASK